MQTVTMYTIITVAVLTWFGTRSNPFVVTGVFLRKLLTSRKFFLHFAAVIGILMFNKTELKIEAMINYQADFTHNFYVWEEGFVGGLQHLFVTPWLTPILAYMYIVVFQSLLIASLGIYAFQKDRRMFYATCYAVMLNYLIAIPFYLFFPIKEVWAFDPTVRFVMLDAFPNFENQYRALSGIDNCFPSLHTSISVTLAMLAIRSGIRRWARFCSICACIIIFTIFYMGIHWLIDSLGGIALGLFASSFALKVSASGLSLQGRISSIPSSSYSRERAE
jgi:membrane-associated phospholipid phosphatase